MYDPFRLIDLQDGRVQANTTEEKQFIAALAQAAERAHELQQSQHRRPGLRGKMSRVSEKVREVSRSVRDKKRKVSSWWDNGGQDRLASRLVRVLGWILRLSIVAIVVVAVCL